MLAHLPIGPMAPGARLERVAALTRAAKATQHPAYIQSVFAWMAASGLARWFSENQHMVNFFLTNVPGPAVPLYVLGGRIREVLPITGLQGNITVMFAALSYCGRLSLVVNADPARWTDIDLFMAAMAQTWCQLSESALAPVAALG